MDDPRGGARRGRKGADLVTLHIGLPRACVRQLEEMHRAASVDDPGVTLAATIRRVLVPALNAIGSGATGCPAGRGEAA